MIRDYGKLLVLLAIVGGLFLLVVAGRATFDQIAVPLAAIVGYVTGNGEAAARGKAPSPMIVPSVEPGMVADGAGNGRAVAIPVLPAPEPPDPDFWEDTA